MTFYHTSRNLNSSHALSRTLDRIREETEADERADADSDAAGSVAKQEATGSEPAAATGITADPTIRTITDGI